MEKCILVNFLKILLLIIQISLVQSDTSKHNHTNITSTTHARFETKPLLWDKKNDTIRFRSNDVCKIYEQNMSAECNKTELLLAIGSIAKLVDACNSSYPTCNHKTAKLEVHYMHKNELPYFWFKPSKMVQGCQGFLFEIHTNGEELLCQYKPYKEDNHSIVSIEFNFQFSTSYQIFVTPLPYGMPIKWNTTSPSECEWNGMKVLHERQNKENLFQHCAEQPSAIANQYAVRPVCHLYKNNSTAVMNVLKTIPIHEKKCKLISLLQIQKSKTEIPTPKKDNEMIDLRVLLGTIFGVLLIICVFFVICMIRLKNHKLSELSKEMVFEAEEEIVVKSCSDGKHVNMRENNLNQTSTKSDSTNHHRPKVVILNRPGCEHLDSILRDLAFILKSYGIHVSLSLLEQSTLDAEGGISSYLQRHIDDCDYIIIVFTKVDQDHVIAKHKPYEFALNVLSGLAYHRNDSSRFIPVYFSSYEEAVKLLPTFLIAKEDVGYRIPKEILELVKKLLGTNLLQNSKGRDTKTNFFVNRMKTSLKKVENKIHLTCNKDDCHKGTVFGSVSNLSSIWASTVYSKWPSFHSINTEQQNSPIGLDCVEENAPFLHAEEWLMKAREANLVDPVYHEEDLPNFEV